MLTSSIWVGSLSAPVGTHHLGKFRAPFRRLDAFAWGFYFGAVSHPIPASINLSTLPRLQDFVQFVTTDIQEISEDGAWGRTRSRVYNLENQLPRGEFTRELVAEIKDILQQETGRAVEVEWISIDDWRAQTAGEVSPRHPGRMSAGSHPEAEESSTASMSDEEVDAILAAARKRGEALQKAIIVEAGGLLTTREAAIAAGLSPKELQRRKNKSLLAIPSERGFGWPRFQFESPATMEGIGKVMKHLDLGSPWMKLNFFLMRLDELGGVRPIDAIKAGNIRAAEIAASHFGTHGGS